MHIQTKDLIDMDNIEKTMNVIRDFYGCDSRLVNSMPIKEIFDEKTVWEGTVDLFDLIGHASAKQCFTWSYTDDDGNIQYRAVLKVPPINTPLDAVRAAIINDNNL